MEWSFLDIDIEPNKRNVEKTSEYIVMQFMHALVQKQKFTCIQQYDNSYFFACLNYMSIVCGIVNSMGKTFCIQALNAGNFQMDGTSEFYESNFHVLV